MPPFLQLPSDPRERRKQLERIDGSDERERIQEEKRERMQKVDRERWGEQSKKSPQPIGQPNQTEYGPIEVSYNPKILNKETVTGQEMTKFRESVKVKIEEIERVREQREKERMEEET